MSQDPTYLIHDYFDGELTDADRSALLAWLGQDPGNVDRFAFECRLHSRLRKGLQRMCVAQDMLRQATDHRQQALPGSLPMAAPSVGVWLGYLGAAAMIGCVMLLVFVLRPASSDDGNVLWPSVCGYSHVQHRPRAGEFEVQPIDIRSIVANDGRPVTCVRPVRPKTPPQLTLAPPAELGAALGTGAGRKGGAIEQ
jgi:anti-sigma factor RsiW